MSSRGYKNSIIYLLGLVILLLFILIISRIVSIKNEPYINRIKHFNGVTFHYPYFRQKNIDNEIIKYINSINTKEYNGLKYEINYVDNYKSILFTKYLNNHVSDYDYLIFNQENKAVDINSIVSDENILKEKIKIYLDKYNISVKNYPNVDYDYLLDTDEVSVILTSTDNNSKMFTTVNIDYHEIEEILKIKHEVNKNYVRELTTTTAKKSDKPLKNKENNSKVIAFTFDDGPSKYTTEIMDILDEYGAKATFFEVGYNIKNRKDVVLEVVERGFEVGNHTTDHSNLNKLKKEKVISKIYDNNETFKEITGQEFKLLRPPYGNCKTSVKELIDVPIIIWNVDSRDWESRNTEKIVELVKKETEPGDIVLFHDLYPTTKEAIKILVPYFYEQGYQIVGVSELFEINGKKLEPGTKYYNAK